MIPVKERLSSANQPELFSIEVTWASNDNTESKACPLHPIHLQKLIIPLPTPQVSLLPYFISVCWLSSILCPGISSKLACSPLCLSMLSCGSSQHMAPAIEKLIICFTNIQGSLFEIFSPFHMNKKIDCLLRKKMKSLAAINSLGIQ